MACSEWTVVDIPVIFASCVLHIKLHANSSLSGEEEEKEVGKRRARGRVHGRQVRGD